MLKNILYWFDELCIKKFVFILTDLNKLFNFAHYRQLKIIETSLLGRGHLEWSIFSSRNNPSFFSQVFGILELLQPHLFAVEFGDSLESILDCYLNLFKVWFMKLIGALILTIFKFRILLFKSDMNFWTLQDLISRYWFLSSENHDDISF